MAVKLTLKSPVEATGKDVVVEAIDLATNDVVDCKVWLEKSKDRWHFVLGENSTNRKYLSHNEFFAKLENNEYIVQDKLTPPRRLGTAQPDRKLIPWMTEEDKEQYDAIIARALENRAAQRAKPETETEKLQARIAKLQEKLRALEALKQDTEEEAQ